MDCPVCKTELRIADRQGSEIDHCPQCRGVWLDRGELDKLIDRTLGAKGPAAEGMTARPRPLRRDDDDDHRYSHDPHTGAASRCWVNPSTSDRRPAMKMEVRANQRRVGATLRHHIEKRLRFALGRFGRQIQAVKVQLSDLNGPRGGVDQCCRVEVNLVSGGRLIVEDTQSYLYAAISRAAERVGRVVARHLARQRGAQRIPIPLNYEA